VQLNDSYYRLLWDKYRDVQSLASDYKANSIQLTVKIILDHYRKNSPLHFNFQNLSDSIHEVGEHLFIELANDIYLNHCDLPDYKVKDKVKRRRDNQYYEIIRVENNTYTLKQVLRKTKFEISPALLSGISYDKLTKSYMPVDLDKGISEKTIKNYLDYFEKLNGEKNEFLKSKFEQKSIFISKKTHWDNLPDKNKIPSAYLPNPREESNATETRSIPALSDCLIYFTPKYEICYQNILSKIVKIKTIVVFDTEADKIEQMLQDRNRYGFNLIILSNSLSPVKNLSIPCWNWFKEEIEIVDSL
jgi:hypothetical protein